MIGRLLSHFRVVEQVGAGGMGVVYRARDERLDRDVALKVLHPDVHADEARTRFRREASALSRLQHPNIATIYDFDSDGDVQFIVMEFVGGEPVADLVSRGPLSEAQVLRIGSELAEALAAAHGVGIVHRDLKPANLRLTPDGRLKILDFGLAKLAALPEAEAATRATLVTSAVVGTVPYMAPEQLRGEAPDARIDIYAAGAVLYELATGRRPFDEPSTPQLTDAILHRGVIPPGRFRPELTPALEAIILKCLEKDPALRYQSASELLVDLKRAALRSQPSTAARRHEAEASCYDPIAAHAPRSRRAWLMPAIGAAAILVLVLLALAFDAAGVRSRLFGSASAPSIRRIAVLPFEAFSRDPAQQEFAAGLTESLTADLAHIAALQVTARRSATQAATAGGSITEIAARLGADALVEASVQLASTRVRVTAKLVAVGPERLLWSDTFDRELKDVLDLQAEVTRAIAGKIRIALSPTQQARLSERKAVNPQAHLAYLRGRALLGELTPQSLRAARDAFKQSLAIDPDYADAWSGLAFAYSGMAAMPGMPPEEGEQPGRTAARRALALDPDCAEALAIEGMVTLYHDRDYDRAAELMQRALAINPSNGTLYHPWADYLLVKGRMEESLAAVKQGVTVDPLSPMTNVVYGGHLYFARRYDEAIHVLRKVLQASPNSAGRGLLASALWQSGREEEALRLWSSDPTLAALLKQRGSMTPREVLHRVVTLDVETLKEQPLTRNRAMGIADSFAMAGDREETIRWLERSYEANDPFILHIKVSPPFDFVRDDPRFKALLAKLHLD